MCCIIYCEAKMEMDQTCCRQVFDEHSIFSIRDQDIIDEVSGAHQGDCRMAPFGSEESVGKYEGRPASRSGLLEVC